MNGKHHLDSTPSQTASSSRGTRRDFFRHAAVFATGPKIVAALLASVERASAIDPPPGSTFLDAEHVVILMQENRSFDHAFGALRGVRGFNDPRAVTRPDQKPVWLQTNSAGETCAPFRLDFKNTNATWLGSLPHSWQDQTDARNHGNHDRWLDAKKSRRKDCESLPLTMGYYTRQDLPFYYALADAFTICDQYFCSSLTATTPNRLFLWTGTIRDDEKATPNVRNSDIDYGAPAKWKTFPERLEEAGVSWRIYQNELSAPSGLEGEADAWLANFTDNPLEWFEQYRVELHKPHRDYMESLIAALPQEIAANRSAQDIDKKEKLLEYAKSERARANSKPTGSERNLHEKAFTTNQSDPDYRRLTRLGYRDGAENRELMIPKGDPLHRFRQDVVTGKLPAVSWLVAPERFSDHPSSPWYGAWYVAEALNILTQNPAVWRKTIFILTYDENDGYFDHVPPFVAPDPANPESGKTSAGIDPGVEYLPLDQDRRRHPEDARGGPIGLGFRVPTIVASPWSRGGYVCSQVFDHTSVLRLLERLHPVRETNISAWRRTISGDLTTTFRAFETGDAAVPFPPRDSFFEQVHRAQFTPMPSAEDASRWSSPQEPGVRPSLALPYELAASGAVRGDRFDLVLESGKAAGAPFHVYTPGKSRGQLNLRTRAYAVAAGDRLADSWDLDGFEGGIYHLRVCGPNGFFREFAGDKTDPPIEIQCRYADGNIDLRMSNGSSQDRIIAVKDHGYGNGDHRFEVASGGDRSLMLRLEQSHNWYDFTVTIEGAGVFLRRFAGRVETGQHGISDPQMSGMQKP